MAEKNTLGGEKNALSTFCFSYHYMKLTYDLLVTIESKEKRIKNGVFETSFIQNSQTTLVHPYSI